MFQSAVDSVNNLNNAVNDLNSMLAVLKSVTGFLLDYGFLLYVSAWLVVASMFFFGIKCIAPGRTDWLLGFGGICLVFASLVLALVLAGMTSYM